MVCDLEKPLPFEDDSFDVATSFFVLEHIENLK
ncbi:methyltransferase domain-containing protein [bacterium]|nr:methyltransferase domain-containing protein [bacterium]